jgi:hypothetical protein
LTASLVYVTNLTPPWSEWQPYAMRDTKDDELGEDYDGFSSEVFDNKNLQNEKFDEYYKHQEVVSPDEWEEMMTCFRKPLPLTFRINMVGGLYKVANPVYP